jgi:macrolide transport system ATP-binding/permease protein
MLPVIVRSIHEVDRGLIVDSQDTMRHHIDQSESAILHRASAVVALGFASFALLLGMVGLYGVIAYSVSQRTREVGIRVALGAQRAGIMRMILKEALLLAGCETVCGIACSIAVARLLRSLLFGVGSWDLPTLCYVVAALLVFGIVAGWIPAQRAASIEPMEALRAE